MNRDEHILGAIIFNFVYWIFSSNGSFSGLLLSSLLAFLGGLAPDILEPPTWSGHRGAFHIIVGPLSILPGIFFINSELAFFSIGGFCIGYFSHFVLDYIL